LVNFGIVQGAGAAKASGFHYPVVHAPLAKLIFPQDNERKKGQRCKRNDLISFLNPIFLL
jgi:hypothetical protein